MLIKLNGKPVTAPYQWMASGRTNHKRGHCGSTSVSTTPDWAILFGPSMRGSKANNYASLGGSCYSKHLYHKQYECSVSYVLGRLWRGCGSGFCGWPRPPTCGWRPAWKPAWCRWPPWSRTCSSGLPPNCQELEWEKEKSNVYYELT